MYQVSKFDSILAVTDEISGKNSKLLGTAFSLGKGVFATAGHVVESLQEATRPSLRQFKNDGTVVPISINKFEKWGSIDFGLIEADLSTKPISWLDAKLGEPTDVDSIGFGFGQDIRRNKFSMRHFKGHVVSVTKYASYQELDITRTHSDYSFWVYELSFQIPKCQSGSPLIAKLPDGTNSIVGIAIGNNESKMEVKEMDEVHSNADKTTKKYQYSHYLYLGQAIASISLLDGESILLGNKKADDIDQNRRSSIRCHLGE